MEKKALVSALRNATLPRLVAKDVPAINMLLWDLFHVDINCESENQDESKLRVSKELNLLGITIYVYSGSWGPVKSILIREMSTFQ